MQRVLGPLARRVALMVGRAVLRMVDDQPGIQSVQVEALAGELRDQVERFQEYGFTSVPLPGAEAAAIAVGGSRDHLVVVAVDDRRYRPTGLLPGEVAIYTNEGVLIRLKQGGQVLVQAATKVRIECPLVELTGDLHVAGQVVAQGDVFGQGTSLHTHVHGGVQSGSSNTGEPA
ncbi:MAG: phage baseplate assembly protein V [Burkholderiales bacterium]|nr:phage baseplate assembly protein V [Burkholderiales bacterium]